MSNTTLRIDIPRHLQDYNGYCGPACALMLVDFAGSAKSPPVFAQNQLFKEVRGHAREHRDRRPVKSPAESLLAIVNDHTDGAWEWTKVYNPDPRPVAHQIFQAIEERKQPCLILVNEGMHWVVAFGFLRGDDGSPSGLLMRDPAWTGMPSFFGLTKFPDTPRVEHRQEDCPCMSPKGKNSPGTVHERFFTANELISHRGLQGAPDHEGEGAIAIVPPGEAIAPIVLQTRSAAPAVPDARAKAGAAALAAVQKSGLAGRPDSPPEWNKALTGAIAGKPTLVKHPTDERDDFFLVPLNPADPSARLGAWAMLDAKTLELREVSLLKDWKAPAFPDPDKDIQQLSESQTTLSDGTVKQFKPSEITPNPNNLVWAASTAAVLPYWPVKEFTVPHPTTGTPEKIYLNQDGEIHNTLGPDDLPEKPATPSAPSKPTPKTAGFRPLAKGLAGALALAGGIYGAKKLIEDPPTNRPEPPSLAEDVQEDDEREDVVNTEEVMDTEEIVDTDNPPSPAPPEVIIQETFSHGKLGVADTGQSWEPMVLKEQGGKGVGIRAHRQGGATSKITNIQFLPNSVYKLSLECLFNSSTSPSINLGLCNSSPSNHQVRYVSLRSLGDAIEIRRIVGVDGYPKKNIANQNGPTVATLVIKIGSKLGEATIEINVNDKTCFAPVPVNISQMNAVHFTISGNPRGAGEVTLDNFSLSRTSK